MSDAVSDEPREQYDCQSDGDQAGDDQSVNRCLRRLVRRTFRCSSPDDRVAQGIDLRLDRIERRRDAQDVLLLPQCRFSETRKVLLI